MPGRPSKSHEQGYQPSRRARNGRRVIGAAVKLLMATLLLMYLESVDVVPSRSLRYSTHMEGLMGGAQGKRTKDPKSSQEYVPDKADFGHRQYHEIRDAKMLASAGQVQGAVASSDKEKSLSRHAETVFPHTARMLGRYEMLVEEIRNQSGSSHQQGTAETEERTGTTERVVPLIARHQSVITQLKAVENLLDPSTIQFENSVGIMNKQQFFSDHEQRLMTGSYQIEDILHHRLVHLANLTSTIVYDDAERLLAQDRLHFPGSEQPERTSEELNPRKNPQFEQLKEFYRLARGELPESQDRPQSDESSPVPDSAIQIDEQLLTQKDIAAMGPFFQQTALRATLLKHLKQALGYNVAPQIVKNTTFYVESPLLQKKSGARKARVSYRYFQSLRPDLFSERHPQQPVEEDLLLQYDEGSIHYDTLKSFEDLHVKALDEREQQPSVLLQRGASTTGGRSEEAKRSRQYQEKYYQRSACALQGQHDRGKRSCQKEPETPTPHFEPPFGSFMREMHEGSKPSVYDYPVEEIALTESQRVLRKIMSMKALHLHNQNFERLRTVYGQKAVATAKDFQELLFTYEEPDHIKALTQGTRPQKIQELPATSSHASFFENEIDIAPRRVYIRDPIYLLTPCMETIKVKNEKRPNGKPITIHDVLPSSPDVDARLENGRSFPVTLQPGETARIRIIATPGNYGRFDALVYILLTDRVFVSSFRAHVYPNRFGLEPIYLDHVTFLSEVNVALTVGNPYPKQIVVEELYLTNQKFEAINMKAAVEANSNKTLCNITYQAHAALPALEQTMVAIRFSTGDYVRVPIYLRTVNQFIETKPLLLDFGLVQLNQQPLKMDVWIRVNEKNIQRIVDYLLPVDEVNLDFKMFDPIELGRDIKKQRKASERQRRQRKPCPDEEGFTSFLAGQVVLDPVQAQFVSTSIQMEVELREKKSQNDLVWLEEKWVNKADIFGQIPSRNNRTLLIEIPIIASVVNHTELFSAVLLDEKEHANRSEPLPLYALDLRTNFNEPNISSLILYPDLHLKNNLAKPITLHNVLYKQQRTKESKQEPAGKSFYSLGHHDGREQLLIKFGRYQHAPGDVVPYGGQVFRLSELPFRNGQHLVWLRVNHVVVPAQIQMFNRQLLCEWRTGQTLVSKGGVTLCSSLAKLDFGVLATGEERSKVLTIWNPNSVAISLDQAIKSQLDDVTIELDQVLDRRGRPVEPVWRSDSLIPQQHKEGPIEIMSSKRTKKYIGLIMQPFESIVLRFRISSTVPRRKGSKLSIVCGPQGVRSIDITHAYSVVEGVLTVQPATLLFSQNLFGMPQSKILTTRSTFSVPTSVLSVRSLDPRVEAKILNPTISPWNVSISVMVTFDPGHAGPGREESEFVKKMSRFGFESAELTHTFGSKSGRRGQEPRGARIAEATQIGGAVIDEKLLSKMQSLNESAFASTFSNMAAPRGHSYSQQQVKGPGSREKRQSFDSVRKSNEYGGSAGHESSGLESSVRDFDVNQPLRYEDLARWQDHRDHWTAVERRGHTVINTSLQIQTDVVDVVEVPVSAKLRKPEILITSHLDFGGTQIGESVFQDVEIMNPSAEPLELQLFVGYDLDWQDSLDANASSEGGKTKDLAGHADRLLRQMNLFVKGVDPALIEDVDGMFETFRRENGGSLKTGSDLQKKPRLLLGNIVDILLSLQPSSGKNQQKQATSSAESRQKSPSKGGSESSVSSGASIEEILLYWKQFEKDAKSDYASKYCLQVLLEHDGLLERESFMSYLEEASIFSDPAEEERLLLSESEDPVALCVQSIKELHVLSNGLNLKSFERMDTASGKYQSKQSDMQYAEKSLMMQRIQDYYQTLYQHVYDLEWLVDKSLHQCHNASPLDHLSNLTSVDNFPSVLKSIEFFEQLLAWKRTMQEEGKSFKRQKIDIDRQDPTQVDSLALMEGARLQLQERYIFYQTQRSPITGSTVSDHKLAQNERAVSEELLKLDMYYDLLNHWYEKRDVSRRSHRWDRSGGRRRSWNSKSDQYWPEREAIERLCKDHLAVKFDSFDHRSDSSHHSKRGYYLETLAALGGSVQEALISIMDTLGYVFAADLYEYARLALTDSHGDMNPLGSLSDRFQLKNAEVQRQMIQNDLAWLHSLRLDSQPLQGPTVSSAQDSGSKEQRIQNFYLNPIYRYQVFTVAPRSNLTIKNAVVFQPLAIEKKSESRRGTTAGLSRGLDENDMNEDQSIKSKRGSGQSEEHHETLHKSTGTSTDPRMSSRPLKASKMQLLVKNNLTVVESVPLSGHGTTAMLELVDIQKDFINVLDEEDELGRARIVVDRISVGDSDSHNLLSENFQGCRYDTFSFDSDDKNLTHALDALRRRQDLHAARISTASGTDEHVLETLFDAQARDEYERVDIVPRFEDQIGSRVQQTSVERYVSKILSQRTFRQKSNKQAVELHEQNYQNYIVFNIPLSDIFRRITKDRQSGQMIGIQKEGDSTQLRADQSKTPEIRGSLFFVDEDAIADQSAADGESYCHSNSSSISQRRMRGLVDKPTLRQRVATILGRWDAQDLRADLNWTELSLEAQRGKVDIVYKHTRYIILQNTGAVPMKISSIKLDDSQAPCSDSQSKLLIMNCNELIHRSYQPRENFTIALVHTEDYKYSKSRKTLTIETDQFSQKFLIDFMVPQRAQILVQKAENQLKSASDRGIFSIIALLGNIIFMLILLYLTMLIAAAMKKDFEEQGILTQDSLLGFDVDTSSKGQAPAIQAAVEASLTSKTEPSQEWRSEPTSLGSAKSAASIMKTRQSLQSPDKKRAQGGSTVNPDAVLDDFLEFCSSSFVTDLLPVATRPQASLEQASPPRGLRSSPTDSQEQLFAQQSPIFAQFEHTNQHLGREPAKFTLEALRHCQMKDLATFEAQELAKRALLGKKNWKRPVKGHESSQLLRTKNAIQAAVAGLEGRLDLLEKEELKKQIDVVSMKVSQAYSVLKTTDISGLGLGGRKEDQVTLLDVQGSQQSWHREAAAQEQTLEQSEAGQLKTKDSKRAAPKVNDARVTGRLEPAKPVVAGGGSQANAAQAAHTAKRPGTSLANEKARSNLLAPTGKGQELEAGTKDQTTMKRRASTSRSSSATTNANKAQIEQAKTQQEKSIEGETAEQEEPDRKNLDDSQNTDHGQAATGTCGPTGTACETKDKKSKVKKFNKKELKKKEARLKREQELAENTKRMEILQQERDRQIQKIEAQMLQRRKREQKTLTEDTESKGIEIGAEYTLEKDAQLAKAAEGSNRKPEHFDEIDIKSYHSSEDESRRRHESPGSISEASGQAPISDQKGWQDQVTDRPFSSKNTKALYNSLDSAQKVYAQTLKHEAQVAASKRDARNPHQQPRMQILVEQKQVNSSFDGSNRTQPAMATSKSNMNRAREADNNSHLSQDVLDRKVAAPDDFWKNYEKQLGILKEGAHVGKDNSLNEIEDEAGQCSKDFDRMEAVIENADRFESMSNQDQLDSKEESVATGKSKNFEERAGKADKESIEGEGYKRQNSGREEGPESQGQQLESAPQSNQCSARSSLDSDQDDDLPLFQQKRYLQLQEHKQAAKKSVTSKSKAPASTKHREGAAVGEEQAVATSNQAGRAAGAKAGTSKGNRGQTQPEEPTHGTGSRRGYEKSSHDDAQSDSCTEMTSRERAQRLALLRSRNPYADINNPNNPNYKGRPGNRDIESYLAQRNILREREQRKLSAVGDSSDDHDSDQGHSYDEEQDCESHYKHYRGDAQRLEAGDSFEDSEEAYYCAGPRFGRASSKYGQAPKYPAGRYEHLADYGNAPGYYRTVAASGGGRGRGRGQLEAPQYEEHYLHRAASRGGRGRGRGRGVTTVSQHKYEEYLARDKRPQQARFTSSRYDIGGLDYYREGTDSADDYHSKQYERRSRHEWHDLRDREREATKNAKNERIHLKYARDPSREGLGCPERDRQYYENQEYAQNQAQGQVKGGREREGAGRPSQREKRQHGASFFNKDKDENPAEKGSTRLEGHHARDSKAEDVKYDHDQIMLMRRARGRALLTAETFQRGGGRGERGGARGDRGTNAARGSRGGPTGTATHQYPLGRARGQHGAASEAYKFKIKEKEQREAANQRKRARDFPIEAKESTRKKSKEVQQRSYSSSESNASNSGSASASQMRHWEQKSALQTEEAEKQTEEQPSVDAEEVEGLQGVTTKSSLYPANQEQRGVQKNEAAGSEAEAGATKSVYETFMDVSSIFSNPILTFKGTGRTRSRFFDEVEEEDDADEPEGSLLQAPSQADNEVAQDGVGAQGSIFSSSHLFGDSQRSVPQSGPSHQSIFSVFGQGLWQASGSNANDQEDVNVSGTIMPQERPQYASPIMFGSGLGAGQTGPQYPLASASSSTGTAGLSSTSFANLRRRALDAGRNEARQNHQAQATTQADQTPQDTQQQLEDPKQQTSIGQSKKFMSLGALPVPKFLQESRARENQYQRLLDDDDDEDEQDAILRDLIQ